MHGRELLIETLPHIPPRHALAQLETEEAEQRLPRAPHSIADIVAHMSFWQDWLCGRCQGQAEPMPASASTGWPVVTPGSWPEVHARFSAGLERLATMADDVDRPVTPAIEFPPLAGYTIRDTLVHIAQHNSHHLGQVVLLRQLMGTWPPPAGSWTW